MSIRLFNFSRRWRLSICGIVDEKRDFRRCGQWLSGRVKGHYVSISFMYWPKIKLHWKFGHPRDKKLPL